MKGMRPLHGDQVLYGVVAMMIDCVSPGQEEWSIDFDLESCRGRSARQKLGKTRPVPRDLASHLKSGLKDRANTSVAKCRRVAFLKVQALARACVAPVVTFFSKKQIPTSVRSVGRESECMIYLVHCDARIIPEDSAHPTAQHSAAPLLK